MSRLDDGGRPGRDRDVWLFVLWLFGGAVVVGLFTLYQKAVCNQPITAHALIAPVASGAIAGIVVDILRSRFRKQDDKLVELRTELLDATQNVQKLEGLLPICAYCKRIRNDNLYWEQLEAYLSNNSGVEFTHGVCPECYERYVQPQIDEIQGTAGPVSGPIAEKKVTVEADGSLHMSDNS